jgi:hypothetical protein
VRRVSGTHTQDEPLYVGYSVSRLSDVSVPSGPAVPCSEPRAVLSASSWVVTACSSSDTAPDWRARASSGFRGLLDSSDIGPSLLTVDGVVVRPSGACKIGRVHSALCIVLDAEVAEALRGRSCLACFVFWGGSPVARLLGHLWPPSRTRVTLRPEAPPVTFSLGLASVVAVGARVNVLTVRSQKRQDPARSWTRAGS